MKKQVMGYAGYLLLAMLLLGTVPAAGASHPNGKLAAKAAAASPQLGQVPLGVGIEGVSDLSRSQMFVDAMKMSLRFGGLDNPWLGSIVVDSAGWPTSDFAVVVMELTAHIGGTYKLTFSGQADVTAMWSEAVVQNYAYNATTGVSTANVVVNDTATQLLLKFVNTGGGARNIKLIRPGYPADTTQVFSTAFLNLLQPFSVIRFMDFTATNGNLVANWADRTPLNAVRQVSDKGAAWEYVVQLANTTHKDIWINIPAHATDDYVQQLATLLHNNLEAGRSIYLEYSNEVWNGGFEQFAWNKAQAEVEVAAGGSPLNADGETNHDWWAYRRVGKRLREVSNIFAASFGEQLPNGRIRPVLASQVSWPFVAWQQLNFLDRSYGPPRNYIHAIAGAPYFDIPEALSNRDDLTADQIFTALATSLADIRKATASYTAFARYYGLHNFAYEGGEGLTGNHSYEAKLAATRDPRMGNVVQQYLTNWYADAGELFMYFTLTSGYSQWGFWGLTDNVFDAQTPKYQGALRVLAAAYPVLNTGLTVPGTIPATSVTTNMPGWVCVLEGDHINAALNNCTFDYLLDVPAAGSYTLTLRLAAAGSGRQVRATVNNSISQTVNIADTGGSGNYSDVAAGTYQLTVGLNVLRLTAVQSGFNLQSLTLNGSGCNLSFNDMPSSNIFRADILYLACRNIVGGFPDGSFRPNASTTRGQFAKIAALAFGIPPFTPSSPSFNDVPSSYFAYAYIEAAAHAGVITGFPDGSFRPNQNVTRAQVAVITVRGRGYASLTPANPTFSDVAANNFAFAAVETLAARNVLSGAACPGSTALCFRPNDNIRRGELSKVVHRAIDSAP